MIGRTIAIDDCTGIWLGEVAAILPSLTSETDFRVIIIRECDGALRTRYAATRMWIVDDPKTLRRLRRNEKRRRTLRARRKGR